MAKRTVNQATRRAREVCQEARDLIRGTKLDTGAYLDRLAKQGRPPEEQVEYVTASLERLARHHKVTQRAMLQRLVLDAEHAAVQGLGDSAEYYR